MKKLPFIQLALIFILISAGALATQGYIPELKKQLKDTFSTLTQSPESRTQLEKIEPIDVETPAPRVIPPVPDELVTKEYDKHLFAAEHNGIGLVKSEDHFKKLIQYIIIIRGMWNIRTSCIGHLFKTN